MLVFKRNQFAERVLGGEGGRQTDRQLAGEAVQSTLTGCVYVLGGSRDVLGERQAKMMEFFYSHTPLE